MYRIIPRLFIILLVLVIRWYSLPLQLPQGWYPDSTVRYTTRILTEPQHTDTQTIIKNGHWQIVLKGYRDLSLGSTYSFQGTAEPILFLGKEMKVRLRGDSYQEIKGSTPTFTENIIIYLARIRSYAVGHLARLLPEPESTLASGILLGVNGQLPKDFQDQLAATGTMHIVAASGYNVMIVAQVLAGILLLMFSRRIALAGSLIGIWLYVLIAGGTAAVVRAGIMGSLTLIAYYFGRPTQAKRLLGITIFFMLLADPRLIADVGFQLSVSATAGLLYIEPWMRARSCKMDDRYQKIQAYLTEYLYPTLAATVATLPIILLTFGRVSWISPAANLLVLPFVPLIMFLTSLVLAASPAPLISQVIAWLVYVPLRWMVFVVTAMGGK